jgi:glycosyltransferase involved in cell wall biosynthesis
MLKIALVRGKYLNNFEGQNFILNKQRFQITAIASQRPIHSKLPFPLIKLPSFSDIPLPYLRFTMNRLIGDSQILFGIEKLARQFDIFHTADPHYYYSYQLAKLRSQDKIKHLIVTSWETIPFNNESVGKKKFIKRFTQKWTDLFICYTDRAKQALVKEGVDKKRIIVIRLGVNLSKFMFTSSLLRVKKQITILFVGRLVKEKGIDDLREAYINVKSSLFALRASRDKQIPNIKLKIVKAGDKSYNEMPKVYQEADIFVLPSKRNKTWEEQYGMVLIEAMASGLPIIAYDSGAIPEVVGEAGIIVKQGDVKELQKQILRLVKDKNLRMKLARMGREMAEKEFDCKQTARKIEVIYKNISNS